MLMFMSEELRFQLFIISGDIISEVLNIPLESFVSYILCVCLLYRHKLNIYLFYKLYSYANKLFMRIF